MSFVCLLCVAAFLSSFSAHAQPANPQQTLNQYISDLQKNPNDYALREKIIKLVQEMKQKPAISREAERFMNRGAAAVKIAKDANDFKDAVAEFEKATLSAPWLANAYYNLGVAQDKAGLYAAAIRSLKLYVLAEPNAPDIRSVEKLIDEIEYKQEKAAKESSPEAVAPREQNKFETLLKKIDGRQYVGKHATVGVTDTIYVRGRLLVAGRIIDASSSFQEFGRFEIRGPVTTVTYYIDDVVSGQLQRVAIVYTFTISEDGDKITWSGNLRDGSDIILRWQR